MLENIQTRYGDVWSIMMMGSSLTHVGWKVPAAFNFARGNAYYCMPADIYIYVHIHIYIQIFKYIYIYVLYITYI